MSDRQLDNQAVTAAVANLYDTYPFPPDPIIDEAPPGYNWRWSWPAAYGFCTGGLLPTNQSPRILDAGCGSGVSTEYLAHLNPTANIVAVDISAGTLAVAQERIRHSCPPGDRSIEFRHLSLYDLDQIEGEFDAINCVGVLHHMLEPIRGIKALASKLAPGGILHIFVYAAIGRWEISLMQEAIALLQSQNPNAGIKQGVKIGRDIFSTLPESNRLVQREKTRWQLENNRDECFADMYVHPQEIDYTIDTLFELIEASGLEFVGFSNPQTWQPERLLANNSELLALAQSLPARQQYRLIELLDTDIAHYEFFLCRPPLPKLDWSIDLHILNVIPQRHPCIDGWESGCLFDPDYQVVRLSELELQFMQACNGDAMVAEILSEHSGISLDLVRSLLTRKLILLPAIAN
jgi:SAM-dependent methyltransferase